MASHHHHHHFCHQPSATATAAAAGCSCCHLPPCHQSPVHPYPNPHPFPYAPQQYNPHIHHEHYFQEQTEALTDPTVSALLRRITSLESALRRRPPPSFAAHSLRDAAARTIQTHFRAFLVRRSRTLGQLKQLASIKSKLGALKSSVLGRSRFDYVAVHQKTVALMLRLDAIQGGGDPMIRDGKRSVTRELDKFLDFIDGFSLERSGLSEGVNVRYNLASNRERKLNNVTVEGSRRGDSQNFRGLVERIEKLEGEIVDDGESELMRNPEVLPRKDVISRLKTGGLLKAHGGFRPKVKKNVTFAKNNKVYKLLRRGGEEFFVEDCDDTIDDDDDEDDVVGVDKETGDDISRDIEVIGMSSKGHHEDEENDLEPPSESGGSQSSGDGEKGLEKLYVKK